MNGANPPTPVRPGSEEETENAERRYRPAPPAAGPPYGNTGLGDLNEKPNQETTDNDPTLSSGTDEAKDTQARDADAEGNLKRMKKDTKTKSKSPWGGFNRRPSKTSTGGVSSDESRRSHQKKLNSTRVTGRLSILSTSSLPVGRHPVAERHQGRDYDDPADVRVVDVPHCPPAKATVRAGKLMGHARLEASEIQPGAVRVRGIHRSEMDESSSKFEDDLDFFSNGRREERAPLEPLHATESGAFSASSSVTARECDIEGGHDSLTITVTASAISREELEQELRDQILREAVVAQVTVDDAPAASSDDPSKAIRRRQRRIVWALAVLAVAAVVVGTVIAAHNDHGGTRVWTPEQLKEYIIDELGSSKGFEMDGSSPSVASLELIIEGGVFDNVTLGAQIMDAFVLLALWAGTGGKAGWTRSDGWNQNPHPCTWFGIECNELGRVSRISLPANNLDGPLNSNLRYLSEQLAHLDVGDNHVGLFRFNLTLLPNLEHLNFSKNTNSKYTIGEVTNYNLGKLQVLDLSSNYLTGPLSSQIAQLTNLRELHLQSNALTGSIPSEFALLKNLTSFRLEDNDLTGTVPSGVCSLVAGSDQAVRFSVDCSSVNCSCCGCGSS